MVAVTHHQTAATLVTFVSKSSDIGIHLGSQGFGQHPASALADDLVDQRRARGQPIVVTDTGSGPTVSVGVPSQPALRRGPCVRTSYSIREGTAFTGRSSDFDHYF